MAVRGGGGERGVGREGGGGVTAGRRGVPPVLRGAAVAADLTLSLWRCAERG